MKINLNASFSLFTFFLLSTLSAMGQADKPYTGYRVYLANLEVLQQSDETLKLAFRTVNTGRQDLEFGKETSDPMQKVVVRFDPLFEKGSMQPHLTDIIASLKQEEFVVVAGKISPRREMQVRLTSAKNGAAPALDENITDISSPTTPPDPVASDILETTAEETLQAEAQYYDPNTCPDLRIESIRVVKQKKNYITIEYTIKNTGKGPAHIEGTSKSEDDNIAVKAFMTSSDKLTKGALVLGGSVVKNRSKNAGPLLPGETHTTKIRIDTNSMTKFTPVIILELDTFGQVRECDETNNKNHIKVR